MELIKLLLWTNVRNWIASGSGLTAFLELVPWIGPRLSCSTRCYLNVFQESGRITAVWFQNIFLLSSFQKTNYTQFKIPVLSHYSNFTLESYHRVIHHRFSISLHLVLYSVPLFCFLFCYVVSGRRKWRNANTDIQPVQTEDPYHDLSGHSLCSNDDKQAYSSGHLRSYGQPSPWDAQRRAWTVSSPRSVFRAYIVSYFLAIN